MAKLKIAPPFEIKVKRELTSASVWDSSGWFMGWLGCKTLKHKYLKQLFWNQIESRLSLSDPILNKITYQTYESCDIEEKLKILDIVDEYNLSADELAVILEDWHKKKPSTGIIPLRAFFSSN